MRRTVKDDERGTGHWVRCKPEPPHGRLGTCEPPILKLDVDPQMAWVTASTMPNGNVGDVWRCDICQKLWVISGFMFVTWERAGWMKRLWYRKR